MIKISHRGNIAGIQRKLENHPDYILRAIREGYHVEIDVRWEKERGLCLGHDEAQYPVELDWLCKYKEWLWIHTKDVMSATLLLETRLRLFFHEKERHTLIYNAESIWTHDIHEANSQSIIPLLSYGQAIRAPEFSHVKGICSDYISIV